MARKSLTAVARLRLAAVVERYKTESLLSRVATSVTDSSGLELAAVSLCRDELERARTAFNAGHWTESQQLYCNIHNVAVRISESATNGFEARSVSMSALLGQVASLLNLQAVDRARELVQAIDEQVLDTKQSTVLARALVELKEAHRARAILDAVPTAERDNERWREASTLVEFAQGNVPDEFERAPSALFASAHHHLVAGEVAEAAAVAFEALTKDPKNSILAASLVSTAMIALLRTIFEDDLTDGGIAVDERADSARKIAAEFKVAFAADLPAPVRVNLLETALNYAGSLREDELLRWIMSHSEASERKKGQPNEVRLAFEFAEKGDLTKALELMPRQLHPWRTELMRAQLLRVAGNQDSAFEILNGLITVWPGRIPIHMALTELLIDGRQFHAALAHAEAAYRGFPTPSMAILLARCLVALEQGSRALQVLKDIDISEQVIELRAYAADQANDSQAAAYWSKLLDYDATDTNAKLHLAAALIRSGDIESSARYARELLEANIDTLERDQLAACGQMLTMARFLPTTDAMIQRAAEALRTRFSTDDKAEMLRLTLVASLGFPVDAVPIDYERLARAGHVKLVPIDDAATLIRNRRAVTDAAHMLYRDGWLDAETLCQVTGIRIATLIVGWSKAATSGPTPLRAAIYPGLTSETETVRGRKYLCSALELLLLQRCGALACIPEVIGDGFLVGLDSTWSKLVEDAYYLEQSTQRAELSRLERLLAKIATAPKLRRIEQTAPEREIAQQHGLVLVTTGSTHETGVDAHSLLRSLVSVGAVSRTDFNHAICHLDDEVGEARSVELQSRFLLENGLLEVFDAAGVLEALLDAAPEVAVTDASIASIRQRFDELEAYSEAARLHRETVEQLGIGLRAGWFRLEQEPIVSALPALREDVDHEQAMLLTRSISQQAVLKELLNQNRAWYRVAADSFGFDSFGHPQQWRMLAFKNERQGRAFIRRYWRPGTHEITLSRFVRSIVQQSQRGVVMRALAQLGFADALLPDDIISLVSDYGRVDIGAASRILDGMESGAGEPQSRGVFARMQLAVVYAVAIWKLAKARESRTAQPVVQQLFARLDELDRQHACRLVEQTVCAVIVAALDDREASFVEDGEGSFSLVQTSVAGQLWQELAAWKGRDPRRRASFRRAVSRAWEVLGQLKDGPTTIAQWAPLDLATDVLVNMDEPDAMIPSPNAVVAVLSALWKERPLARRTVEFKSTQEIIEIDVERILSMAATEAAREDWRLRSEDGTSLIFSCSPGATGTAEIRLPIEAVILRAEPQAAVRMASTMAIRNGVRDGRLYQALIEFSKAPTDKARRKFLGRAACDTPFRLVADDPRFIYSFGDRAISHQGYPATLDELRELLSEPNDLGDADARTLVKRFFDRFERHGAWFDREDRYQLAELASRVPGPVPSAAARSIFQHQSLAELNEIERALTVSQNMPIGMLSMAAAFGMLVLCSDPPPDNMNAMEAAFVGMLSRESSVISEKGMLASFELSALQSIARVVSRFTPWGTSSAEHSWLTTRLYEWWIREVKISEVRSLVEANEDSSWQRLRSEVVLNVMLDILEATVVTQGRVPNLPGSILETLKDVASRDGANPFEPARRPAWIYWDRPQGCEWLASSILLWGLPDAFFDLRPELRIAILEKLPHANKQTNEHGISFQPVFRALSRGAGRLTEPEFMALQEWLNSAESGPLLDLWRADLLTGIFAARGDTEAAAKLRQLAGVESLSDARVEIVGGYLEAASSSKAVGMESTVIELFEIIRRTADGDDQVRAGVALALGRPNRDRVLDTLGIIICDESMSHELANLLKSVMLDDSVSPNSTPAPDG